MLFPQLRAQQKRLGRWCARQCLVNKRMKGYSSVMKTIVDAIYESGKLVLQQPLPLPEHAHVRVTVESDLERASWLRLSEDALMKTWDNDADDIFNELIEK